MIHRTLLFLSAIMLFLSCKPVNNNSKQQIHVNDTSSAKSQTSDEDTIPIDSDVFIIGDKKKIAVDSITNVGIKFKPYIHFSDFEAPIESVQAKAPINFSSNPMARQFRTAIRKGYKNGINFGGHYCLIEWGCGSPCHDCVLVDVKTGIVYNGVSTAYGYDFKKESRMIIGSPPGTDGFYLAGTSEVPSIFIWNEQKKKFEERLPLYR